MFRVKDKRQQLKAAFTTNELCHPVWTCFEVTEQHLPVRLISLHGAFPHAELGLGQANVTVSIHNESLL